MRTTANYFVITMLLIAFNGCDVEPEVPEVGETQNLTANTFPQAQQQIQETLDDIFKSIQKKDADRLISFHHYGPKFTEFKDGEHRTGSVENEAYERGLIEAIDSFDYDLNGLKIDVFGNVGKVTFHADFRPTIGGVVYQQLGQVTLIFVRMGHDWKIVHEHFSPLIAGEGLIDI